MSADWGSMALEGFQKRRDAQGVTRIVLVVIYRTEVVTAVPNGTPEWCGQRASGTRRSWGSLACKRPQAGTFSRFGQFACAHLVHLGPGHTASLPGSSLRL